MRLVTKHSSGPISYADDYSGVLGAAIQSTVQYQSSDSEILVRYCRLYAFLYLCSLMPMGLESDLCAATQDAVRDIDS